MIEFEVYGDPAPQGSKKHVGRGIMVEASKKVGPWRERIRLTYAAKYSGRTPFSGPVSILIAFTVKKPASAPKTRQTWPSKRPDLDKLVRSTFDGLTQAGAWTDDSLPIELVTVKRYPNEGEWALDRPGAYIRIVDYNE